MRKKLFFLNTFTMSVSAFIMNISGIFFSAYISKKIGAEGVGLFGLIMSVYGFCVTLATSGINLAATRLIADEMATSKENSSSSIMKMCLLYALSFGMFSFLLLFFSSGYVAENLLCDSRTEISLKALSVSMPLIAMSSAMSGYFIAHRRGAKSALSQLFEQAVKISLTIITLHMFKDYGTEISCLCMVASGTAAEIISFLFMVILYKTDNKKSNRKKKKKGTLSAIFKISLPIATSAYLRSLLVTVEHMLIPRGLKKFGLSAKGALDCYGVIHGMTIPLLLFPSCILKSAAGLLVPELSECNSLGHRKNIMHIVSKSFKTAMVFSICASGIYFCFADELGIFIYKNENVSYYLRLLAPLSVMMYVDGIVDGMLKGLNQQVYSMWYNIIDSAVSILAVVILLPKYGAVGYIAVIYISELLNAFLSLMRLIKITDFEIRFFSWILIPSVSIYASAITIKYISGLFLPVGLMSPLRLVFQIMGCVVMYLMLIGVLEVVRGICKGKV